MKSVTLNPLLPVEIKRGEQHLGEIAAALSTLTPSEGRRTERIPLTNGLYVLCRRNKDGTVSRFLLARLRVNTKVRETGLGSLKDTTWQEAWRRTVELHREAHAERVAAQEADPYWGRKHPRRRLTRGS